MLEVQHMSWEKACVDIDSLFPTCRVIDATGWSIHDRLCQSPGRCGMDHHLADGLAQVSTKP